MGALGDHRAAEQTHTRQVAGAFIPDEDISTVLVQEQENRETPEKQEGSSRKCTVAENVQ